MNRGASAHETAGMRHVSPTEPSDAARQAEKKARHLEVLTIIYLISATIVLYLTLGSSQAMRAAWFEDLLSLIPPIVFLIASRIDDRDPGRRFPFGLHRATSIGHLASGLALLLMGLYLVYSSAMSLLAGHHPTIGSVTLFGEAFWLGWLMLPALLWTGIPAVFLGRAKQPLAEQIHNKVLYADADMNAADWKTAGAAFIGVLGVGLGFWWADAAAALVVGADILKDGVVNTKSATTDLLDQEPTKVDHTGTDPIIDRVREALEALPWVTRADVRLREQGQMLLGNAFLELDAVPETGQELCRRLAEARDAARGVHWRIQDVVVTPNEAHRRDEDQPKSGETSS